MKTSRHLCSALALLVLAACPANQDGDPDDPKKDAAATPQADAAAADPSATIGAFDLRLVPPEPGSNGGAPTPAFTAIQGQVRSGPRPPMLQLELAGKEGVCELHVPTVPFCDPPCTGGVCVTGGSCVANPEPRSVGTVTFTGVALEPGSAPLSLPPVKSLFFYQPDATVKVAFPPFSEGADVQVSASGGDLPAFKISSKGIRLLEVTSTSPVPLEKGKPMQLRWTAPGKPELSQIEINLDISHHGGFKGELTCTAPDNGSLDVPAALVGKLIDLGVAGYPTVTIMRRATASAQVGSGRVAFNITSERTLSVVVAGFISCGEDEPCPAGKTCQQNQTCK